MNKTIMVVDDSASIRQMVGFTLGQAGYSTVEAHDGQDAITKLSDNRVDMIITDLNMPRLDGISLIKSVRQRTGCKFLPIIMLTTESEGDRKTEARLSGATGWMVKPFKPDQLLAVVKKVMR